MWLYGCIHSLIRTHILSPRAPATPVQHRTTATSMFRPTSLLMQRRQLESNKLLMSDIFAMGFIVFALGIIISEILVLENNLERTLEDIHKIRDLYRTDDKFTTFLAYKR